MVLVSIPFPYLLLRLEKAGPWGGSEMQIIGRKMGRILNKAWPKEASWTVGTGSEPDLVTWTECGKPVPGLNMPGSVLRASYV